MPLPREITVPLAHYRDLSTYVPIRGDFTVWAGFFSTWIGVVQSYDPKHEMLEIIFGGLPILLVSMDTSEYTKNTRAIPLSTLRNASKGVWAVIHHESSSVIWYV